MNASLLAEDCNVANYRPISIPSVMFKVLQRLVSVRLVRFIECTRVLPTTQFVYRKGHGICDVLQCVSRTFNYAMQRAQEAISDQIDFSVAFERFNII